MTQEYDNTNSGALFKNDEKQTQNQPDYKGEICMKCPDCGAKFESWLSSWIKTAKRTGRKFMSLAATPKDTPVHSPAPGADSNFDDDIPF